MKASRTAPAPLLEPLRLLGDEMRLRILRVLLLRRDAESAGGEALNVSELVHVLGTAQSGVSRNVGLLREAGFLREERRGGWVRVTVVEEPPPGLDGIWPALCDRLRALDDPHGDDARVQEVLLERRERGEDVAGPRPAEPGRSWSAWARALGHLLPRGRVADVGCGEGALTLEVARWAASAVGVDPDERALVRAREAARRAGRRNANFRRGSLDRLPLADGSFDLALLSQVLHRVEDPARLVGEAARVVAPGGCVLVLDLLPHREDWVRERMGHVALGFPLERLSRWLEAAGLEQVRVEDAGRRRGNPFTVSIASGRKEGA
jgi:ArsR family transcriptional regulator